MISTYLAMQNAILAQNTASTQMVRNAGSMLSSVSFGNSQPLRPSFGNNNADTIELQQDLNTKSNETKVSFFKKIYNALKEKLSKDIDKSTPKYAGVDYKA